jgi:polyhydroxyalkanoate synthesis regulator protein
VVNVIVTLTKRQPQPPIKRAIVLLGSFWNKGIALLALANLILVLFDLTYIPLRNFWLQGRVQLFIKIGPIEREFPDTPLQILPFRVTDWYDWVKGIEPYRDTEDYLQRVEDLNNKVDRVAVEPSQQSQQGNSQTQEETIDAILKDLRDRSAEIIDTNPFLVANKTGILERIKNKMRDRVFGTEDASSKEAFETFWSKEYLEKKGFRQELNFFEREIQPLIETNYYRPVGENGEPVDNFGLLDFPFFAVFLFDFLVRTFLIARRHTGVSWFDAMLWRWYDVFLLVPLLRWLRVIPVTIRLNQARLIDLHAIQKQVRQGFVANIAEDITEVVVVQIIAQFQGAIRDGEISNLLSRRNVRQYIDLNQVNEISELTRLIINTFVERVLPKLQPDIEALLKYNIQKAIAQTPAYQNLRQLPGMERLQTNLSEQLTKQIYQGLSSAIAALLKDDPVFNQLLERLITNFSQITSLEFQAEHSLNKIESLLIDLLEEIKINYIQRLSQEDIEKILEETRIIRQVNLS